MASQADLFAIYNYFGSQSSIYQKIQLGTATDRDISFALSQIPRMQADVSASGRVLGYTYADPVYTVPYSDMHPEDIIQGINSNSGNSSYGNISGKFPISFGRDEQTGQAYINAGTKTTGGAMQTISAVADRVSLGVIGVNLGAKFGKKLSEGFYNIAPDFWDEFLPTMNPETWPAIAGENEAGRQFIRTLFDIAPDNSVTGYVDERIVAQYYQSMRDLGIWNHGTGEGTVTWDDVDTSVLNYPNTDYQIHPYSETVLGPSGNISVSTYTMLTSDAYFYKSPNLNNLHVIARQPHVSYHYKWFYNNGVIDEDIVNLDSGFTSATLGDITVYSQIIPVTFGNTSDIKITQPIAQVGNLADVGYLLYKGDIDWGEPIPGVSDIDGSTQYPPTNITGTTLEDVLQELKQEYPDLFQNPIQETVLQPDGSTDTITMVPLPWQTYDPTDLTQTSPITQPNPTQEPEIDPQIAPDIVVQVEPSPLDDTTNPPPTTPDTGTGTTSPVIPPVGNASSLWAIYNPTQAQVNAFGAWLWSSNFVEQLKKLFNDPMQAIIGIHKVFATPQTGGSQNIVCGYLDSGVSSKVVTNQYTEVDCGSIDLREFFGNVFDYPPYTNVKLFLPFIGIVSLDVDYIMRSTISVKYSVDVLTGACLANVEVMRDGGGGVLFTYAGSAIVTYPISSGSYTGVVSGALSVATGIVGTLASGGAALPAVMGALSGIGRMHTDVQHSGSFSGPAGAMGGKKPYLIISRPQIRMAYDVENYLGKPSNVTMPIGDCNGFVRVTECHLSLPNAYESEIKEIEQLLKTGVIISDNVVPKPVPASIVPLSVTENGTYEASGDVIAYNPVTVNIPDPELEELIVTQNGTYTPVNIDGFSSVVVNVPFSPINIPQSIYDFCDIINVDPTGTINFNTGDITLETEYRGNIYNNNIFNSLNLTILGDFSQGGSSTGNILSDSIENYNAIILQGIYNKSRTSNYNTSMLYYPITLNKQYWAGMKDRNSNYECKVTFTNNTTVSLTGNRQVIIYGLI